MRPSWNEYFALMAHVASLRSTCPRARVGVVLVKDRRVVATGYNGSPAGLPHCLEVGCLMVDGHCQRAIHAEQNAIVQAALHGVSTAGTACYCTHYPCSTCAKLLINAGVSKVFYLNEYRPYEPNWFDLAHIPAEQVAIPAGLLPHP